MNHYNAELEKYLIGNGIGDYEIESTTADFKAGWDAAAKIYNPSPNTECNFKIGDNVIAFNYRDWCKVGNLPEGNTKYLQRATILKLKYVGEWLADLKFENGLISNGHFIKGIEPL